MKFEYGPWTASGMLEVRVDGEFAGYLSEDVDGWIFWRALTDFPNRFEMHAIAPTRKAAVLNSLAATPPSDSEQVVFEND